MGVTVKEKMSNNNVCVWLVEQGVFQLLPKKEGFNTNVGNAVRNGYVQFMDIFSTYRYIFTKFYEEVESEFGIVCVHVNHVKWGWSDLAKVYTPWMFSIVNKYTLTAGDVKEVLSAGSVDLDVALSDVMLVFTQSQIAMFFAVKTHQRFAITSSLLAQAKRHATPEHTGGQQLTIYTLNCSQRVLWI